jgi:multidrug transporter EmrE-like cation transporter
MHVLWTIALASVIEFIGDANFKAYARTDNWMNLLAGIAVYGVMIYVIIRALKRSNVAYMNVGWDGISAVIETLLAVLILHETLSNGIQWMGLALIVSGIFALSYGQVPI